MPSNDFQPRGERTAQNYIDAVNMVLGIVEMTAPNLPGNNRLKKVADVAVKVAPVVREAAPAIAPIINHVADVVGPQVPEAMNAGAAKIADAAQRAGGAMRGAGSKVADSLREASEAKAQEKARKLARKTLLDGAGVRMSAEQFCSNWSNQEQLDLQLQTGGQPGMGYLDYSGCYVVVTCDSPVKKDDYSKYRDLYVGKAVNMGQAINDDFIGKGNPDVYADVKFKQHVYVLLYPCAEEKIDELHRSLIVALDADQSYNRVR